MLDAGRWDMMPHLLRSLTGRCLKTSCLALVPGIYVDALHPKISFTLGSPITHGA